MGQKENLALFPANLSVIAEMLGLAAQERQRFKGWSDDLFAILGIVRHSPNLMERASHSLAEMRDYITALSKEHHLQPKEDLLTALVTVVDEGNRLTQEELAANVGLLLAAGHETTANLIGNGLLALLRNPDQMQQLRDNPTLITPAAEEMLRYDNPVQIVYRSAIEDVGLGGKRIGKGQLVNLIVGAANRDPAYFSQPDRFDLTHNEGQIAFTTVLSRFPQLQMATNTLEWQEHPTFRGLKSLPVAF